MFKLKMKITGSDTSADQTETSIIIEKTFVAGIDDLAPDLLFGFVSEQIEMYRANFEIVDKVSVRLTNESGKVILAYGDLEEERHTYVAPVSVDPMPVASAQMDPEQFNRLAPSEILFPSEYVAPEPTIEKTAATKPPLGFEPPVFNHEKVESMDGKGSSAKRMVTEASNKMVKAHLSRGDVIKFEVKRKLQHFKNLLPYNFGEIQAGYFYVNVRGEGEYDAATGKMIHTYLLDGAQPATGEGEANLAILTEQEVDSLLASSDAWQVHAG